MFSRILCAIDGSKAAERAVEFASTFAAAHQAELRFITVTTVTPASASQSWYWDTQLFDAGEKMIASELAEARTAARKAGVSASCVTVSGRDIAAAIVSYAQKNGFDHIVMGSTGHSAFGRLLTGSVVDSVLNRTHPPVTVI